MISFDLVEPVFVLEMPGRSLLLESSSVSETGVFWIDEGRDWR